MELRHLRYFVAVAEELSFTKAAEKLHLAQPSLTRQIRNLEEELEVRLLDRIKNRVSLTEEGHTFLVDARRLLALSMESVTSVRRVSRGESGQLNLGYLFKYNFDLLPETLSTLYLECPEIAVNLFDMFPGEQLRALEARKIDLGFVGLRPTDQSGGMASPLEWQCISRHSLVVALPHGHSLTRKKKVKVSDLKDMFFVAMSEQTHPGSRAWLNSICHHAGFVPRVLQDVELESGLMTFVAEGLGVTLAREQIRNLPHSGVEFRPLDSPFQMEFWIAWHRENSSRSLSQYLQVLKKQVAGEDRLNHS